jgi:hypothetical protein
MGRSKAELIREARRRGFNVDGRWSSARLERLLSSTENASPDAVQDEKKQNPAVELVRQKIAASVRGSTRYKTVCNVKIDRLFYDPNTVIESIDQKTAAQLVAQGAIVEC